MIWRWQLGGFISDTGFDVLLHNIDKTRSILGENSFQWIITHNNLSLTRLNVLKTIENITLIEQNWQDIPIPVPPIGDHQNQCSLWKIAPPRLDISQYEIIVDNDCILMKRFKELDDFLSSDSVLLFEDPLRFFGSWDKANGTTAISSGFIGLPPNYDFKQSLIAMWEKHKFPIHNIADEQGFTSATLMEYSNKIIVRKEKWDQIHPTGKWSSWQDSSQSLKPFNFDQDESIVYHFTEINRKGENYLPWIQYNEWLSKQSKRNILL